MREHHLKSTTKSRANNGIFIRFIEKLFGIKLQSYSLFFATSFWTATKISVSVFTIIFVGDLLLGVGSNPFNSASFAFELAGLIFVTMSLFGFLFLSIPHLYGKVFQKDGAKKIAFTFFIVAAGLALYAYTSLTFQTTSNPAVLSKEHCVDKKRICEEKKSDGGVARTNNDDASNETDDSILIKSDPNDREVSLKLFNELRDEYGIDEFSVQDRVKLIEETFSGLFDDDEVEDWGEYLYELDSVALTKPSYTQVVISKAILNEVPFHVLVKILDRGHQLNGNHVSMLASTLSLEEFVILENYGVNITAPSSTGSNALVSSLFNKERDRLFNYFILNDQLAFTEEIDVFRAILETSSNLKFDTSYARKALDHGIPVSTNAKLWIESELKKKDLAFYKEVKSSLNI